jgi:hypothetical protein
VRPPHRANPASAWPSLRPPCLRNPRATSASPPRPDLDDHHRTAPSRPHRALAHPHLYTRAHTIHLPHLPLACRVSTRPIHLAVATIRVSARTIHLAVATTRVSTRPIHLAVAPIRVSTRPIHLAVAPTRVSTRPIHLARSPIHLARSPIHLARSPIHPSFFSAFAHLHPAGSARGIRPPADVWCLEGERLQERDGAARPTRASARRWGGPAHSAMRSRSARARGCVRGTEAWRRGVPALGASPLRRTQHGSLAARLGLGGERLRKNRQPPMSAGGRATRERRHRARRTGNRQAAGSRTNSPEGTSFV